MTIWFFRILFAIIILIALESYFFISIRKALKQLPSRLISKTIVIIGIFVNLFPIALLLWAINSFVAKSNFTLPQSPYIDWLIIYPFWFSLLLIVQSLLFFIPLDLILPIIKMIRKNISGQKVISKIKIVLMIIFAIYIPLRIIYDYNEVKITRLTLKVKNLPEDLNNFRIGFVSDFHVDRYTDSKRVTNYINKLNEEKPDLVLIGGDFISRGNKYIKKASGLLSNIRSTYGVYSCVGDHDYWAYSNKPRKSLEEITYALARKGIQVLDNLNITIPIDSSQILITAITNTYVKKITQKKLNAFVDSSLYDFKIFLTHQPRRILLKAAEKNKYNLYLCGHTHGGQLSFIFPFTTITPSRFESEFLSGKYYYKKLTIYVCNGLGMSIAPVRYNSTPEVAVFKLVK